MFLFFLWARGNCDRLRVSCLLFCNCVYNEAKATSFRCSLSFPNLFCLARSFGRVHEAERRRARSKPRRHVDNKKLPKVEPNLLARHGLRTQIVRPQRPCSRNLYIDRLLKGRIFVILGVSILQPLRTNKKTQGEPLRGKTRKQFHGCIFARDGFCSLM